ncbi:MAG: DUF2156 domain-containing protein [Candidatus Eremiobacteraeota bacterium]|nr:DUF2156 domain-containing protein [Candidatus Eremiobacteraeota bacterium]
MIPLELLDSYGRETVSRQSLKGFFSFYQVARGAVAYEDTGGYWLAVGTPWASEAEVAQVARQFSEDARRARRKVAFFGVEPHTLELLPGQPHLKLGAQPVFDPVAWVQQEADRGEVGRQTRRAGRKGVEVRKVELPELLSEPLCSQVSEICREWVESRPMALMGFLVTLDFLDRPGDRTFFLAETADGVCGVLACIPARDGWFFENLVARRGSPNGTCSALVSFALGWMADQGCRFATLGMAPLAQFEFDEPEEGGPLQRVLRFCYQRLNWLYNFHGLYSFKSKFEPDHWEPVYLVAPDGIGLGTIYHMLRAFAGGSLVVFGLATLGRWWRDLTELVSRRVWATISYFLAIALLPWIVILLTTDSSAWFGCPWLAQAWAAFDLVVAIGFLLVGHCLERGRSWGSHLATLLVGVVGADVFLTWSQAFLYNLPRQTRLFELLVTMVAMAAPAFAFLFLLTVSNSRYFRPGDARPQPSR